MGSVTTKRIRSGGRVKYVQPAEFDPNPLYCPDLRMAFDPKYGPVTEAQIEYHRKRKTPGAEEWEVGQPAKPFA